MKNFLVIFLFALYCFSGCKNNSEYLQNFLQNKWETTFIEIKMPTHNQSDSLFIYKDNFEKEGAVKAQSIYHNDFTFESWYMLPNGRKHGQTNGKWSINGSILTVRYFYGSRQINAEYSIKTTKYGFKAKSVYDWDNDGEQDDTLFMQAKQIQ